MVKKRRIPGEIEAVLKEHRARIDRLAERRGVQEIKKLYVESQAEAANRLRRLAKSNEKFRAVLLDTVSSQLRDGQAHVMRRIAGELGDASHEAQQDSVRSLSAEIKRIEKHVTGHEAPLPIDEAARFRKVIDGRRQSLLRAHDTSMARYGGRLVVKMEDELAKSVLQEESFGEAIDRVEDVADVEWWQGERIVRTELMGAFNAARVDGLKEAANVLDDLRMRWVEHVSDSSFEPLDQRVGKDSIAMHAQVVHPGGLFRFPSDMPDGGDLPEELDDYVGESWGFPPDRPNDRSSLAPWRPHWGIPAWEWVAGERRWLP